MQILIGTHNKAKIERLKLILPELSKHTGVNFEIFTPQDFGIEKFEVEENGQNEQENAYIKAKAYWEQLPDNNKIPTISLDTGCYLEGVLDDEQPGQRVRRLAGKGEETTDEEMVEFYKNLCSKYGGQIHGYYFDAHCIFFGYAKAIEKQGIDEVYYKYDPKNPNLESENFTEVVLENVDKRHILLTNQVVGDLTPGFPMMSMYKFGITGKYHAEITQAEYLLEMTPILNSLVELVESFPDSQTLILGKYKANMPVRRRSLAVLKIQDKSSENFGKYLGFIKHGSTNHLDMLTWPGGGVDPGESPSQAVLREIEEELGYTDLELHQELGGKILHYFDGKVYKVCSVTYGFEVVINSLNSKIEAEIDTGIYTVKPVSKSEFLNECKIEMAAEFLKRINN